MDTSKLHKDTLYEDKLTFKENWHTIKNACSLFIQL